MFWDGRSYKDVKKYLFRTIATLVFLAVSEESISESVQFQ